MSEGDVTEEERILRMVKRVLTDVARDTHTTPGLKHPLSENTIQGIRECLGLITARESELARARGQQSKARPRYVDEPQTSVVVPLNTGGTAKKGPQGDPDEQD